MPLLSKDNLNLVELESLVDSSPDLYLRFDHAGLLKYANPAARQVLSAALHEGASYSGLACRLADLEIVRVPAVGPAGEAGFWIVARPARAGTEQSLIADNQSLRLRQFELEALKSLSDRLINVYDIKEGIRTLDNYLDEVLDFSAAVYFIVTPEESSGFIHSSHRKELVEDAFLAEAKRELARCLRSGGGPGIARLVDEYEATIRPLCPGWNSRPPGSHIFFPLKIGGDLLGGLLLASRQQGLFLQGGGWLADAMVMTFLLFVVRWQTQGRAQKSRTESLVASLSDGVIMFNGKLRVVLANRQALAFTGLSASRTDLSRLGRLMKGIDLYAKVAEMLVRNRSLAVEKYRLHGRYYQLVFTPVKDNQGKVVGGAIVFHDIDRQVEIDQMKTDFVYIASHQLRTPLTGIKWFVKLLKKELEKNGKRPPARQRQCLEHIIVANDQVIKLVNDLLNISRIESGHKFKIEQEDVAFRPLIEAVKKDLAAQIGHKRIRFKVTAPDKLSFLADQSKIRQVFHNLIDNAVKYSPAKGEVSIRAVEDGNEWGFSVSDRGMGIPKNQHSRVFEKFFRADNATSAGTPGTGLGLNLAKALVEAHGGKMRFESREGKGTTFFFTIPRV